MSTRSHRTAHPLLITALVCFALPLGCGKSGGESDEDSRFRAEAKDAIDKAETLLPTALDERKQGMIKAIADVPLRGSKSGCEHKFAAMREQFARPDVRYYEHVEVLDRETAGDKVGEHRSEYFGGRISALRADVDNDSVAAHTSRALQRQKAMELMDRKGFGADVTLVIDNLAEPTVAPEGGAFERGILSGRMFVWDYQKKAVVCVAPIHAGNSKNVVMYGDFDIGKLVTDLKRNAIRVGLENLVAVGEADQVLSATGGAGAGVEVVGSGVVAEFWALVDKACACRSAKCGKRGLEKIIRYTKDSQRTQLTNEQIREFNQGVAKTKQCIVKLMR